MSNINLETKPFTSNLVRLMIHGKDGSFPFLTPYILRKYFSPDENSLVKLHLILGIAINDCCVTPIYSDKGERKETSKNSNYKNKMHVNLMKFTADIVENPTGYTFMPQSISTYFCIPTGYQVMLVPAFDRIDECYMVLCNKTCGKISGKNKNYVCLPTSHGMQVITLESYNKLTRTMSSSFNDVLIVGLFDQAHKNDGKRRKDSCKMRNEYFIEETHHLQKLCDHTTEWDEFEAQGKGISKLDKKRVQLAPVPCSPSDNKTSDNPKKLLERLRICNSCAGVVLIGWHHMKDSEQINMLTYCVEGMRSYLTCIEKNIRKDVAVMKVTSISQLFHAVKIGATIIGTELPSTLTEKKRALMVDLQLYHNNFGLDNQWCHTNVTLNEKDQNYVDGVDLSDKKYMRDYTPLVSSCQCPACKDGKYTRAYIYHLIHAKELLGDILLYGHNLYQMLELCREMTVSIVHGSIEDLFRYISYTVS